MDCTRGECYKCYLYIILLVCVCVVHHTEHAHMNLINHHEDDLRPYIILRDLHAVQWSGVELAQLLGSDY